MNSVNGPPSAGHLRSGIKLATLFGTMQQTQIDPRVMDPGKGPFCDVDKKGIPLSLPPRLVEPQNGIRHPEKSAQDRMPVDKRPRKQLADRQRSWIETNKPTRSSDYVRMPRS